MIITQKMITKWGPGFNKEGETFYPENLKKLFGKGKTPLEIIDGLPEMIILEKLWILIRPEIIPEKLQRKLDYDFIEHVMPIWSKRHPNDDRPEIVLKFKQKYLCGNESETEWIMIKELSHNVVFDTEWSMNTTEEQDNEWLKIIIAENYWQLNHIREILVEMKKSTGVKNEN